jgi:RHS repeat-associated protein
LTDKNGAVVQSYAYSPYGKVLAKQGTSDQIFTFVGKRGVRQEGESGELFQMRLRYFDAVAARFLSRELLWPVVSNPQMLNGYQYAFNDPVLMIDPSGLEPEGGADLHGVGTFEATNNTALLFLIRSQSAGFISFGDIFKLIKKHSPNLGPKKLDPGEKIKPSPDKTPSAMQALKSNLELGSGVNNDDKQERDRFNILPNVSINPLKSYIDSFNTGGSVGNEVDPIDIGERGFASTEIDVEGSKFRKFQDGNSAFSFCCISSEHETLDDTCELDLEDLEGEEHDDSPVPFFGGVSTFVIPN